MGDSEEPAGQGATAEPNEKADRTGWADAELSDLGAPAGSADGFEGAATRGSAGAYGDRENAASPPVVGSADADVATALAGGAVVAVPGVGGYCLAVRIGAPGAEARIEALAADPDGPHYAVGHLQDAKALTSGWSVEVERLLERCWPGPVDVFLPRAAASAATAGDAADASDRGDAAESGDGGVEPGEGDDGVMGQGEREVEVEVEPDTHRGGWAVTVGMPDGRALRRLCKAHGPWRTVPLTFNEASEVANAFDAADVALVIDGGRRDGELPTLVDATVTPVRVLREGALPSNFIDATMAMGARKRFFSRSRAKGA